MTINGPGLIENRKAGNEAAAIGALKTVNIAQTLFREADKDGNDILDYAPDLETLSRHQLIDPVLGSGTKQGYIFSLTRSSNNPELRWNCTAKPQSPGTSGIRYFYIDETGVIRYETDKIAESHSLPMGR